MLSCVLFSILLLAYKFILKKGDGEEERSTSHNYLHEATEHRKTKFSQRQKSEFKFESIYQLRRRTSSRSDIDETNSNPKSDYHLLDFIDNPAAITPFDFSNCRMSNCFDFSRCQNNGPLKVHIVPVLRQDDINTTLGESNLIHKSILKIIRESVHFEAEADKACIFVLEDDTLDRDPLSQSFRSYRTEIFNSGNQYGMNHLVFNLYSGSWPFYKENDFTGLQFKAAILAKASNSIAHHRPQFDISLPLFSYQHPISDSKTDEVDRRLHGQVLSNRTYFLTFKGKRYVYGSGSETRNNLYHLNNQRDVIMLTTCRHGKRWRQSSDVRCSEEESNYDKHDFIDLMKESTFCLTPRGRRLGSFRFLEALSYGCIPVILSDGWVKPFNEIINWSCAAVEFDESLLFQVPDILRDIPEETLVKMREKCLNLYLKYFSTTQKIILTTLAILEKRIKNQMKHDD